MTSYCDSFLTCSDLYDINNDHLKKTSDIFPQYNFQEPQRVLKAKWTSNALGRIQRLALSSLVLTAQSVFNRPSMKNKNKTNMKNLEKSKSQEVENLIKIRLKL